MLVMHCPNCGARNVSEFHYGGEYRPRPAQPMEEPEAEWTSYLYLRRNLPLVQTEWWYHQSGCGLWFLVERDGRTNVVLSTRRWAAADGAAAGGAATDGAATDGAATDGPTAEGPTIKAERP